MILKSKIKKKLRTSAMCALTGFTAARLTGRAGCGCARARAAGPAAALTAAAAAAEVFAGAAAAETIGSLRASRESSGRLNTRQLFSGFSVEITTQPNF